MHTKSLFTLLAPAALLLLLVVPAHAAPSLNLQNRTSYSLSGSLTLSQTCTADPLQYQAQACGFGSPQPSVMRVSFAGNLGWTVQGLDSSTAVLQVDHTVSVAVSPLPFVTLTPVTEQGSFTQAVNLATRVESPGTATSILRALLFSTRGVFLPPVFSAGRPLTTTLPQQVLSQMPALASDPKDPVHTMWWVNGPLTSGSPVQIITGWSSVTGQETLNLGSLGTRSAWLVTSSFAQSLNIANPLAGSSNATFSLNLLWSFDKRGDLLLRNNVTLAATSHSVNMEQVFVSNPCAPSGWCPTFAQVTVTRMMTANLTLALKLASTDLNLNARMNGGSGGSGNSSLLQGIMALPWLSLGPAAAGVAGLVSVGVWAARRNRGKTPDPASSPSPTL